MPLGRAQAAAAGAEMPRAPLLLLVMAAWLYAPDVALISGYDPSGATYQANGLYMAFLSWYAFTTAGKPSIFERAVLVLSIVLSLLQTGCDFMYGGKATLPTAAICDDVTNRPINLICAAAVLAVCALADHYRGHDA